MGISKAYVPMCPICGCRLYIGIRYLGHYGRKINKDGTVCRRITKYSPIADGSEFLNCTNSSCSFTYDFWSNKEKNELFEKWYEENIDDISFGIEE